ncbi:MAG: hypothetical protein WDZ59_05830 [Pirellulales bacterium]
MRDPLKQYRSLMREAQYIQRMLAPTQQFIEQLEKSSSFSAINRLALAESAWALQHQRELHETTLNFQRMAAQVHTAQTMAERLQREFGSSIETINSQAEQWRALVEPAIQQLEELRSVNDQMAGLADSFTVWESATTKLARDFLDVEFFSRNVALAERLFAPSQQFTDFARDTVSLLERAADGPQAWVLRASLEVAEEQLIATSGMLGAIIVVPDDGDSVSASRPLNAPYIQQEEMLSAAEEGGDEDSTRIVQASPAAYEVNLSRQMLKTIATCNEIRKVAGQVEIFKPTTRLLEVFADVPWLIPTDKESFACFVDCLYFLFYEGAGKDNLRFLKTNGGPIDDADFDFILCIKHLRNKWIRHDADHGDESAIKKSWAELSSKFQWLGLTHLPVSAEDFRLLHMNLLAQSVTFVNKILQGLVA